MNIIDKIAYQRISAKLKNEDGSKKYVVNCSVDDELHEITSIYCTTTNKQLEIVAFPQRVKSILYTLKEDI